MALAPLGKPLTLNVTIPLKPLEGVTVTVYVVDPPRRTLRDEGDAESEKSGAAAVTVCVNTADVAGR